MTGKQPRLAEVPASFTLDFDFATVLPTHVKPETWVRLAQGALKKGKRVDNGRGPFELEVAATNNPGAFLAALLDAARQGHRAARAAERPPERQLHRFRSHPVPHPLPPRRGSRLTHRSSPATAGLFRARKRTPRHGLSVDGILRHDEQHIGHWRRHHGGP